MAAELAKLGGTPGPRHLNIPDHRKHGLGVDTTHEAALAARGTGPRLLGGRYKDSGTNLPDSRVRMGVKEGKP